MLVLLVSSPVSSQAVSDDAEAARQEIDEIALGPETADIDDEFFAFVIGLISADVTASFGLAPLLDAFPEYRTMPEDTPIMKLERISRFSVATGSERRASLAIAFDGPLEYPVPVDFLGYHPGVVKASQSVQLTEEAFAYRRVRLENETSVLLAPLYILEFTSGSLFIDFDALVDRLFFGALDDLDARLILLFRYEGAWYAMLAGEGHRERILTWTFNLETTEFMLRPPRALRGVAERFVD
jgi:hypothetical protein